jgi:hypothetical protein
LSPEIGILSPSSGKTYSVGLKTGIERWPHLRTVPGKRWISHTHPTWLCNHSLFKISSPGPVFYGTKWLLWRPHKQSPTCHSKCRIDKGLIKRGSTIDHWWSRCKDRIIMARPLWIQLFILIWAQLIDQVPVSGDKESILYLKAETDSSLWNIVFLNKKRMMGDVQKRITLVITDFLDSVLGPVI